MSVQKRVVTAPTFHHGILYPTGAEILIDLEEIGGERKPGTIDDADPGNLSNLAPKGTKPTASGPVSTISTDVTDSNREEMDDMKAQLAEQRKLIEALTGGKRDSKVEEEPAEPAVLKTVKKPDGSSGGQAEAPFSKTNLAGNSEPVQTADDNGKSK